MDKTVDESGSVLLFSKPTLLFFGFCSYIVALTTTVTHEMLLLGRAFTLPPLGAEVSLEMFYAASPLALMAFHLYLLLLDGSGIETYTLSERWGTIIRWTIYAILPLAVLLFIQGSFLAYHSRATTRWQQVLVTLDLGFIVAYRRKISDERWRWGAMSWLTLLSLVGMVLVFSWFVAAVPDPDRPGLSASCWPFEWPARNLSLREVVLIERELAPELRAEYAKEADLSLDEAHRKNSKGISLRGRNLTGADFTGAELINVDFRGADLREAIFVAADLRGARFMPAGSSDGRFDSPPGSTKHVLIANAWGNPQDFAPTRLEKANFTSARLEGASLILVNAAGAILNHADLRGVELTYADLSRALLREVNLAGADLWHATLQGADLTYADLRAANLAFVDLEGAVLERALVTAADLSKARLAGAWFTGANLRAVDFRDAQVIGANFRDAMLWSSRGLLLQGIILRQAKLDALCLDSPPYLVDFREVQFPSREYDEEVSGSDVLEGVPEGPPRKEALERLQTRPAKPSCGPADPQMLHENLKHRGLLYHDERRPAPLKDWPPVEEQALQSGAGWTEDDFYAVLTDVWIETACHRESTARAMIRLAIRPPMLAEEGLIKALKDRLTHVLKEARQDQIALQTGQPGFGRPCPALLSLDDELLTELLAGEN